MAYGDRTRIRASRSAGHLGRSDHVRSKKTAKVAGHPSYSSGIVNASFPIGANTAVWQESIFPRKATKALRAVVPLLRGPQISEYNRNLSEMHWVAAKERTWWRGSRPREAGRDGSARVLRMSLICCTLPFRSLLLPIRLSSERKRGKHERMDWRPPDRRSISVVAGKGRMDAAQARRRQRWNDAYLDRVDGCR